MVKLRGLSVIAGLVTGALLLGSLAPASGALAPSGADLRIGQVAVDSATVAPAVVAPSDDDATTQSSPRHERPEALATVLSDTGQRLRPGQAPDPVQMAGEQRLRSAEAAMRSGSGGAPGSAYGRGTRTWQPSPASTRTGWPFRSTSSGPGRGAAVRVADPAGESDVTIVVTDLGTGQPVQGATADVWFYPSIGVESSTSLRTDASGSVTVTGLPAGWLEVRVWHNDLPYISQWRDLWVDGASGASLPVALVLGGSISGTVLGPDGAPLEDVCVTVTDQWWSQSFAGACTEADGTYQTSGVAEGDYRVLFRDGSRYAPQWYNGAASLEGAEPVFVSLGTVTDGIDARMQTGARISGTVRDASGAPLRGWVSVHDSSGSHELDGVSVLSGEFTTGPLMAGTYTLIAGADGDEHIEALARRHRIRSRLGADRDQRAASSRRRNNPRR